MSKMSFTDQEVDEILERCGLAFFMRLNVAGQMPLGDPVFNGLCTTYYEPWMIVHLKERPANYRPCYLNHRMMFGVDSIHAHLQEDHGFSHGRVGKLSVDNAYRLHDMLHGGR